MLRLTARKYAAVRVPAAASPTQGGPQPRVESPSGGSTLTTSAPRSARSIVQYGPARTVEQSTTRRPASGAVGEAVAAIGRDGSARYPRAMIPPRWFLRIFWAVDRDGLAGVRRPAGDAERLARPPADVVPADGRANERQAAPERPLLHRSDGTDLVVVASNVGDDRDPAWWRNLQTRPEAEVEIGADAPPRPRPPGDARGGRAALRAIRRRHPDLRRVPTPDVEADPGRHPRAALASGA